MSRSGFRRGDRQRANAKFRALPAAMRQHVSDALEENADELAEAIRRRVPADRGDLTASVTWKKGKAATGPNGTAGADPDLTVRVIEGDEDTFYAGFVEHGTVNHPAQPHFFPTYRQMKRKLKSRLTRAVRRVMRDMAAAGIT